MSKGGSQTVTQQLDPGTQAYVDQIRRAALGYTGLGGYGTAPTATRHYSNGPLGDVERALDAQRPAAPYTAMAVPPIPGADPTISAAARAGQQGFEALTGGNNPFMNTYLGALNPVFDQLRQEAMQAVNQQATLAGAYGGSRQGVATGTALGDIAQTQALTNYQAFNDAQQRALAAANLGLGASQYLTEYPQAYAARQIGLLTGAIGPYGTMTQQPYHSNIGAGILGGAATGMGAFGPPGAVVGGLLGAFS